MKLRIEQADELLKEGNLVSAHFAVRKILRKEPDNVSALILEAEIALRRGNRPESVDIVSRLFELRPADFGAAHQQRLGHICFANELHSLAARLFSWAADKVSLDGLSLYQLGACQRRLGKLDSAEKALLECIKLNADIAAPYLQLGHLHKARGDSSRAEHYYKRFIALAPAEKGTGYWALADLKSYTFSDEEIAAMRAELSLQSDNPAQVSSLYFALGWAEEMKKNHSAAMTHYDKGNALQSELEPFDTNQYRQIISGLKTVEAEPAREPSSQPPTAILIVGLPRSGTTLVEQILSAHSRVQATDELPFLERIAHRLEMSGGYAARLSALTDQERELLRQQYMIGASDYAQEESDFIIDKYPGNFLHIGLAKRIMPECLIIDVRRDPRDVAISAYRQLFAGRNAFTSSFESIYEYYRGYLTLVDHWQSVYPEQIRTINYEELVSSPEKEIGALLEFCDLESETACFEFHKQKRAVMTPSVSQVSKPMFTSSVGQWRQYEDYASDAMKRLGSLVATTKK